MQKQSFIVFPAILLIIAGGACSTGDGLENIRIDESNRTEVANRLTTELSIEEGKLLEAYIQRNHPDLESGQLPVGATIAEMIAAQRTFESSRSVAGAETGSEAAQDGSATLDTSSGALQREAQEAKAPPVTVAAETPLRIRLDEALSSETAHNGQSFAAHLDSDLKVNDTVVAPRGSRVTGRVTDVAGSGRVKGRARMSLALTGLRIGDTEFELETYPLSFEAEKGTKDDALKIGIGAAAGAVIGAIAGGGSGAAKGTAIGAGAGTGAVLLTRGEQVEFAAEQIFQFRLREELTLPAAG